MTRGFTLLEMLIAMVLIAVVGISISTAIGNVANQRFSLERRTIAHWIGQNHITRMRIARSLESKLPDEGTDYDKIFMGLRDWEVKTKVINTQYSTLKRIEIDVYEVIKNGDVVGPFEHLVGFIGEN